MVITWPFKAFRGNQNYQPRKFNRAYWLDSQSTFNLNCFDNLATLLFTFQYFYKAVDVTKNRVGKTLAKMILAVFIAAYFGFYIVLVEANFQYLYAAQVHFDHPSFVPFPQQQLNKQISVTRYFGYFTMSTQLLACFFLGYTIYYVQGLIKEINQHSGMSSDTMASDGKVRNNQIVTAAHIFFIAITTFLQFETQVIPYLEILRT